MNKEFIPYEEALALKELEFDMESIYVFNGKGQLISRDHDDPATNQFFSSIGLSSHCIAPLYQQAFRWFREKGYRMSFQLDISQDKVAFDIWREATIRLQFIFETDYIYHTYEEAELACLKKLIEIAKNK
jgi:sugar/nucleoside kinase (ribokinase family)